jgi:hypothetical protein
LAAPAEQFNHGTSYERMAILSCGWGGFTVKADIRLRCNI